jgi:hypothetical protein
MQSKRIITAPKTDAIISSDVVDSSSVCGALYISDMDKVWKDIPGFENYYSVSDCGDIYSKRNGRNLKLLFTIKGYLYVIISAKGIKKRCSIHRIVAELFIPNPENKPQVNHKNGIKTDNYYENLEWNTQSENMIHAFTTGIRKDKGDGHYRCKIKKHDYIMIFALRDLGWTYKSISKVYEVTEPLIWHIINK